MLWIGFLGGLSLGIIVAFLLLAKKHPAHQWDHDSMACGYWVATRGRGKAVEEWLDPKLFALRASCRRSVLPSYLRLSSGSTRWPKCD